MCVFAPVLWLPRELLGYLSYRDTLHTFALVLRCFGGWICFVWFLFPSWLLPSASLTSLLVFQAT